MQIHLFFQQSTSTKAPYGTKQNSTVMRLTKKEEYNKKVYVPYRKSLNGVEKMLDFTLQAIMNSPAVTQHIMTAIFPLYKMPINVIQKRMPYIFKTKEFAKVENQWVYKPYKLLEGNLSMDSLKDKITTQETSAKILIHDKNSPTVLNNYITTPGHSPTIAEICIKS